MSVIKTSIFAVHFSPTFLILLLFCSTYQGLVTSTTTRPNREALSIIIGGGDDPSTYPSPDYTPVDCPPPPPPTPPSRVEIATRVIQRFIKRVDSNNCGLTKHTTNLCDPKFSKYGCTFINKYQQQGLYAIQYNECNIRGQNITLVDFIEKLPDVSIFHANSNNFVGEIPILSNLPFLFELDLSNNKYTGKFPVNVLGATQLTFLDLRFNSFEGPIPSELFNLQVLALFINNNNFEYELPSTLGSTPASFITFANNKFTGPIPKSIGQASKTLLEILFLNNKLSGCLPCEIGLLKKARVFDVSTNLLTGPIPRSFGCLQKMQYLVLSNNKFYGPIPDEICKLPLLKKLDLANNFFTQVGPECMKLIEKKVLDVKGNCILGLPYQKSPKICDMFLHEPKSCGDEGKRLSYMPCKITTYEYDNYNVSQSLKGIHESETPVTYAALTPNNN